MHVKESQGEKTTKKRRRGSDRNGKESAESISEMRNKDAMKEDVN